MLGTLTPDDFKPLLGQRFRVVPPHAPETLTLIEVTRSSIPPLEGFRQGFSLLFEGASRQVMMAQGIRPLEHDGMGRLDLFLVPMAPGPGGAFRYEAVFG